MSSSSPADSRTKAELADLQAEVARLKAESQRLKGQPSADATVQFAKPERPNGPPAVAAIAPTPAETPKPPASVGADVGAPTVALNKSATQPPAPAAALKPTSGPSGTAADDAEAMDAESDPWLPSSRTLGAFTTSMIVHAVVFVAMAFWVLPSAMKPETQLLTAAPAVPQEEITQVLEQDTKPSAELNLTSSSPSSVASAVSSSQIGQGSVLSGAASAAPAVDRAVADSIAGPQVGLSDLNLWSVPGEQMKLEVAEGAPGEPSQVVDDYADAMDRITHEILMMLLKNDVLVMWIFDQSESMNDDRQEIRERVERVYAELGLTEAAQGDALLTAVGSYGEGFMMHTKKPTSKIEEIREAIDQVPNDPTGKENMCPAIGQMIAEYRKFSTSGKRKMALIMVTDESGELNDNLENLEKAIAEAKAARCRIYVLGRESVFGYPYAYMAWTEPTNQWTYWLQINRGPETAFVEQLQTDGFTRRYDAFPSGFGPYEQTRMARETGGIFFLLPSPEVNLVGRDDRKYELQAMRPYLPDLGPRQKYADERNKSELRKSIAKVINDLNPWVPEIGRYIDMRIHFSIKPQEFLAQVAVEQDKAKQYVVYLDLAEKALEALKSRRDNEPSPRWRANYDLLFAQVLAYKVRIFEYGAYLEHFIKSPKPIKNPYGLLKRSTHWTITTRHDTITGELTKGYIERSAALLYAITQDHAGTPYSARAQWELARGFGVELVESYDDPRRAGAGVKLPNL